MDKNLEYEIMSELAKDLLEYKRNSLTLENKMLEMEKSLIKLKKYICTDIAFRGQVGPEYIKSVEKIYNAFLDVISDINKLQINISKLAEATSEI